MKISDKIRILRKMKGWSQEELGNKLVDLNSIGVSRQAVSDWENDKSEPKLGNIKDLSELFNVSFDILLNENINLDDNETLEEIIRETKSTNNKTIRSIVHYFYYFRIKMKEVIAIPEFIVSLIFSIILFIKVISTDKILIYTILLLISYFFTIHGLLNIFHFIYKCIKQYGRRAGCLTYNHLRIEAFNTIGTTIYVPIRKVEHIKALKTYKNYCGDIEIKIKDRKDVLVLKNIFKPLSLVNTYYQIVGPDKDLENIKL